MLCATLHTGNCTYGDGRCIADVLYIVALMRAASVATRVGAGTNLVHEDKVLQQHAGPHLKVAPCPHSSLFL